MSKISDIFNNPYHSKAVGYNIIKRLGIDIDKEREKLKQDTMEQETINKLEPWIQTYTGKKFFPLNPRKEDICIIDIAHALSMLCRFTGHTQQFYSVADHSIYVSHNCKPDSALYGLIHDASEAFLQDFSAPIKRGGMFENYREYEHNLQSMIYSKFGLGTVEPKDVKEADLRMLATEARDLMGSLHKDWQFSHLPFDFKIKPLSPANGEALFIERFKELVEPEDYKRWINE